MVQFKIKMKKSNIDKEKYLQDWVISYYWNGISRETILAGHLWRIRSIKNVQKQESPADAALAAADLVVNPLS